MDSYFSKYKKKIMIFLTIIITLLCIYRYGFLILITYFGDVKKVEQSKDELNLHHKMDMFCDSLRIILKCKGVYLTLYEHDRPINQIYILGINYEKCDVFHGQNDTIFRQESFRIANNMKKRMILEGVSVKVRWQCIENRKDFSFPIDSLTGLQ